MTKRKGKHPSLALTGAFVHEVKDAGFYADGNGLYLRVDRTGLKRWILRTRVQGKRRDLGLGSFSSVSLIVARVKAGVLRRTARQGEDPAKVRDQIAWISHPEVLRALEAANERIGADGFDPSVLGSHPSEAI